MRIRLYEDYLVEDITAVRNQYLMIDDNTFDRILNCDPTYNPTRDSVGKYTKWLLNLYKKNDNTLTQALYRNTDYIMGALEEFDDKKQALPNKDIGQFKSFDNLIDTLSNTDAPQLSKRQQQRKDRTAARHSTDYEIVFQNDEVTVYVPLTKEASIKLGAKTTWCTASNGERNMFDYYTKGGKYKLYIFELKNGELYQYSNKTQEFRDADNRGLGHKTLNFIWDKDDDFYYFCRTIGMDVPIKSKGLYSLRQNDIKEIRLLSIEEYQKYKNYIPHLNNYWWWLRSPGSNSYSAAGVFSDGDIYEIGCNVNYINAVRPALLLNSKSELALDMESNLNNSDFIMFNHSMYVRLAPFYYLLVGDIGRHRFDPESNNWETSEIRKWLNNPETILYALGIPT